MQYGPMGSQCFADRSAASSFLRRIRATPRTPGRARSSATRSGGARTNTAFRTVCTAPVTGIFRSSSSFRRAAWAASIFFRYSSMALGEAFGCDRMNSATGGSISVMAYRAGGAAVLTAPRMLITKHNRAAAPNRDLTKSGTRQAGEAFQPAAHCAMENSCKRARANGHDGARNVATRTSSAIP